MADFKYDKLIIGFVILSFVSILFRTLIINPILIGISILFIIGFSIKHKNVLKTKLSLKFLLVIAIPFIVPLVSLIYSEHYGKGAEIILRLLPLVIIPYVYLRLDHRIINESLNNVYKYFPITLCVVFLVYVGVGFYMQKIGYGDYLFYSNFSAITNIHSTYSALMINLAIVFLLFAPARINSKLIYYLNFIILILLLVLISNKISLIALIALVFIKVFSVKKKLFLRVLLSLFALGFIFFMAKDHLTSRLSENKLNNTEEISFMTQFQGLLNKDIFPRLKLWKSNYESLETEELIFGKGIGSNNDSRIEIYKKYELENAVKEKYNAHNQFFETLYFCGLIGVFFLLYHCISNIIYIVRAKKVFSFSLYITILLFFMTESILVRQIGIILYSFVLVFIFNEIQRDKQISKT